MSRIGLKPQQIEVGKKVYYYAYADKYQNSEPKEATITNGVHEICGTLICWIDISTSCVALSNLSFECLPEKHLTARQIAAKERYAMYDQGDGVYDGISFGEFLKCRMYERD